MDLLFCLIGFENSILTVSYPHCRQVLLLEKSVRCKTEAILAARLKKKKNGKGWLLRGC